MTLYFTPETFTPVDSFSREVQISRDEFLHQLPDAIGKRAFDIDKDLIAIRVGEGEVAIRMTNLENTDLGQLDLPMMRLDFAFHGLSDREIDNFMDSYEQQTTRGSGGMQVEAIY